MTPFEFPIYCFRWTSSSLTVHVKQTVLQSNQFPKALLCMEHIVHRLPGKPSVETLANGRPPGQTSRRPVLYLLLPLLDCLTILSQLLFFCLLMAMDMFVHFAPNPKPTLTLLSFPGFEERVHIQTRMARCLCLQDIRFT